MSATEPPTIETLRSTIDDVDNELMQLVSMRIGLTRQIAFIKIRDGLPISDIHREEAIIARTVNHPYGHRVGFLMRKIISICRTEMYQMQAEDGGKSRE